MSTDRYELHPGLVLSISGDADARRHFAREYAGATSGTDCPAAVEAVFGTIDSGVGPVRRGGHKTMSWELGLSSPSSRPRRLCCRLQGVPRGFALSLVQSYYLEPLLSMAAVDAGAALLPAGAFVADGEATVMIGLSGSGKTSLCMSAIGSGLPLLGDDQVFVGVDGTCGPFARRFRLYPDLRNRVPEAYRLLGGADRARLVARQVARTVTAGWLAPSLSAAPESFGLAGQAAPAPVGRIILLKRGAGPGDVKVTRTISSEALRLATAVYEEQRSRLSGGSNEWSAATVVTARQESSILGRAFALVPVWRVEVPTPLGPEALAALTERILALPSLAASRG